MQSGAGIWPERYLTPLSSRKMTCSAARARIFGRCETTVFRLQRCAASRVAQQAMFTSVHSSPCSMTYASRSLDCAILVSDQRSRVIECVASACSDFALVPFKGVVARDPSGGVCPIGVHLPEPHFFAVSDSCRRLTHVHSCVRSLRHPRMLRVFRAVLLRARASVHARLSVLWEQACIGCMRVAILHSLRN